MAALAVKLILAAVGIGVVGLVASEGTSQAKPASNTPMPAALVAKITAAVATADPVLMRKTADEIEKAGYPEQAASLRAAAKTVETGLASVPPAPSIPVSSSQGPPKSPGIVPALPAPPLVIIQNPGKATPIFTIPEMTIPGNVPGQTMPTTTDAQRLAGRCALDLATAPAKKEDKTLVTAYQAQEKARGFYVGNLDGLYGPKTALCFANDQRIIPPKPRYWPKNNMAKAKLEYASTIMQFAIADQSRFEEWAAAGRV